MSIRRNFVHNVWWHPWAGWAWTIGDLAGKYLGLTRLMYWLRGVGDRLHERD